MKLKTYVLQRSIKQTVVVAEQQFAILVSQVESIAFAISEHLAVATLIFLHPTAVTEHLVAVGPHIPEIICVDVALMVVGSDARTGGYTSVGKDRPDMFACIALVECVTHLRLIAT